MMILILKFLVIVARVSIALWGNLPSRLDGFAFTTYRNTKVLVSNPERHIGSALNNWYSTYRVMVTALNRFTSSRHEVISRGRQRLDQFGGQPPYDRVTALRFYPFRLLFVLARARQNHA